MASPDRAKNALFDDSDDGDDDVEGDTFKVRPQFEGKKGQKLLELQSRFAGGDDRFRIDARFREERDDGGGDGDGGEGSGGDDGGGGELDLEAEKKRNLKILQSIVGDGGPKKKSAYFR